MKYTFIGIGFLVLITSCTMFKSGLSSRQQSKVDAILKDYPDSKSLLLINQAIVKIDDCLIDSKNSVKELLKLDTNSIEMIQVHSNVKTVERYSSNIKYDLVIIKTSNRQIDNVATQNGFDFLNSKKREWLDQNPNPIIVINGFPFMFEEDYKPFLQELKETEIASIDILKESSAMVIYKYKSVLIITTNNN